MKNNRKILLKIGIVLAFVLVGVLMFFLIRDISASKHKKIDYYMKSTGGGMDGGYSSVKVQRVDDKKAKVVFSSAEWHNMDPVVNEYYVDVEILAKINEAFDDFKLYRMSYAPKKNFFVLDEASTSYRFEYEDGKGFGVSDSDKIFSEKNYNGIKKISEIIDEAIKSGEKLSGLVLNQEGEEPENAWAYKNKKEVTLRVYKYMEEKLSYSIYNGLEENLNFSGQVELYRVLDGEEELICSLEKEYSYDIEPGYEIDESIKPGEEHLKPGVYRLVVAGYETTFEIE